MTITRWCFVGLLFFLLSVVLVSSSCSQGPGPQSSEEEASLVREFIAVVEDALQVRTMAGGYSSGNGIFIEYDLEGAPPQASEPATKLKPELEPSEAATNLKQELEFLGGVGIEAGVVGDIIIVDFEQLPFKSYTLQGFIQVYDQHLFGYLKFVSP